MTVTSRKVINGHHVNNIGHLIASKAFAHLMPALIEGRKAYAEEALYAQLKADGITMEEIAKVQKWKCRSMHVQCNVRVGGDCIMLGYQGHYWDIPKEERAKFAVWPMEEVNITDEAALEAFRKADEAYSTTNRKMINLGAELSRQLMGKTVAQACKAWPEAAEMICHEMNVPYGDIIAATAMVTPLSQLLAQYLPALPAPTNTAVSA